MGIPITKIEVKAEPLESDLGDNAEETSTEREGSPNEHEEQAPIEIEDVQVDTLQNTGDTDERITSASQRQQSTEEPEWTTPPRTDVLFKPNPNYVPRTAVTNRIVAEHVRVPTPPPEPQEEDPLPPPPLLPPHSVSTRPIIPIAVLPNNPFGIIPASQMKRKRNFEVLITIPAKRFKPSHHSKLCTSSEDRVASSSRNVIDNSVTAATHPSAKKYQNPKPKVDSMNRRLPRIPFRVTLDPEILNVTVTRRFIAAQFGGHPFCSYTKLPPNRVVVHGYDHFVFAQKGFSPQAPSAPGAPGLITHWYEHQWPDLCFYRLFVRIGDAIDKWQYMGLYKATKLSAWSPDEIKQRRVGVGHHWARDIRSATWARPMIARIVLRQKLGREPTRSEVATQVRKIKEKSVEPPSTKVIVEAFENGDEKLYPWKVECKDYEEELQWEIAVTYPHYEKLGVLKKETPC